MEEQVNQVEEQVNQEPQQVKQQVPKVTKPKNPGRVAAGKRLAEYNRKQKEKLNTPQQVTEETLTESTKENYNIPVEYIGLTVIGVIIGGLYIYQKCKTPKVNANIPKEVEVDPFHML